MRAVSRRRRARTGIAAPRRVRSRIPGVAGDRAGASPFVLLGLGWTAALCGARPGAAQDLPLAAELPVEGVEAYAESVPRPEAVLGYVPGLRHTEPHRAAAYLRAVAATSDRVTVHEHATSWEERPLVHAVVTSAANHARLEEILRSNRRLSAEPRSVPDTALDGMPVIVYLAYSVHGNEASGTEAALVTLYHLAAGRGAAVEAVLDSAVVLIEPYLNPDGRERFVDHVNRNRGLHPTTDPRDREHSEPWPGGRTNHYWFDLNRDWLPARHPESRGRLELFHRWRPQLLADFHEMGGDATYFFQPGIPSRTNPNTPQANQNLTREIARFHARALDRIGQLYYTEETFDDFYYGKGSTYPDVNGAVGILFEQASSRALQSDTDNGRLHYATTVRNQVATSLSTLEAAVALRRTLLAQQRAFYAGAEAFAAGLEERAWLIGTGRGPGRARELVELLLRHRIRVHRLARDVTAEGHRFRAGDDWIVPADQAQARLVHAVMERPRAFSDSLFYDVSAWTLPLAFDVDHAALAEAPGALLGEPVVRMPAPPAGLAGDGSGAVAWLVEWDGLGAARFVFALQRAGLRVRVAQRPLRVESGEGERAFPSGAVIVVATQGDRDAAEVREAVRSAAVEAGIRAWPTPTALTPEGPDLGGASVAVLEPPRLAIVTGPGTRSGQAGEVWYWLDAVLGLPVSLVDGEALDREALERYGTLVLAGGAYGSLDAEAVAAWVREGGTLIALSSAVEWVGSSADLVDLDPRPFPLDSLIRDAAWSERWTARGAHAIGGAILAAELDPTHPLAWGIGTRVPVFRRRERFETAAEPVFTVGVYAASPVLAGYVSEARGETIPGALAAGVARVGRGRVVLLPDEPAFRGFWFGAATLLTNAVVFGNVY